MSPHTWTLHPGARDWTASGDGWSASLRRGPDGWICAVLDERGAIPREVAWRVSGRREEAPKEAASAGLDKILRKKNGKSG